VNTDCDCRDSQADPLFVIVALGEFTGVKFFEFQLFECKKILYWWYNLIYSNTVITTSVITTSVITTSVITTSVITTSVIAKPRP
jgi:hypothetical protein